MALSLVTCAEERPRSPLIDDPTPQMSIDMAVGKPQCVGLGCKIAECPPTGSDTVVYGKVTAPNGVDPIREAIVYVPASGIPEEFPGDVSCEVCNSPIGGTPVTQAITGIDGTFELHRVPVTDGTPIVIQKGRWRKTTRIKVEKCERQALTAEDSRLPRTQNEGSIPKMAVAVGNWDAIECVLRGVGLQDREFSAPAGSGAVHLYNNRQDGTGAPSGVSVSELLTDLKKMKQYNLIFLNCSDDTFSASLLRDAKVKKNLVDYVAAGGRMYITDWSYDFVGQPPEFAPYICFNDDKPCTDLSPHGRFTATGALRTGSVNPLWADIDQTHQGGKNLATWMSNLPDPSPGGRVKIVDDVGSWVLMQQTAQDQTKYPSTTWLWGTIKGQRRPVTVTFDYPAQNACGKVLYATYHTRDHSETGLFPSYCPKTKLIPQEQVLEYLIFEISSCVGPIG
ncbi:MAG TPA: hypothetical protein PK493_12975 [Pseudomonadota bacterium]|nr:hypothetical protein [Pseudomonadota bacterium]